MDLTGYSLVKERTLPYGGKIKRWEKEGENTVPVEQYFFNEKDVKRLSLSLGLVLAILLPAYLVNVFWIPLFLPFAGSDVKGNPCGKWLTLRGMEDDVQGFGKFKKHVLFVNLLNPESRKRFAFTNAALFFFGGALSASIIADGVGYKGLEGLVSSQAIQSSQTLVSRIK